MFARFANALFNHLRFNENQPDSENNSQANYIPLNSEETLALTVPAPAQASFASADIPQVAPFVEVEG